MARILARKHLSASFFISDDLGYLEKLQISNQSALSNLYASFYLGMIAKGKMHETDEAWINNFVPCDSQSMSLAHAAAQFGNPHPVISRFLKTAEQESAPHIREILCTWTHLMSLRFAADQLPETAWQDLKGPLEAIWKWRAPTMRYVLAHLFPGLLNAQNAATCLTRYLEHSRHPTGIFSYTAKMQNGLVDHEKASVLAAIGQFVNAAVLSPDPEHAFRQLRYEPARSPHLRLLADKAPTRFAQWQQPCIYEPSAAFLDEAAGGTEKTNVATHLQPCAVIDTDAAEDLFLCGTEVVGSCQSIQEGPRSSKALMGYVLGGKYRLLAIKSADERLMGRRMLRLLWDEQAQQPVLHLERLYRNPGVPKKYQQALVELALQKARQMRCALVSHDQALPSDGDYSAPLIAYPTPWPFEYIDAKGLGVRPGIRGYQLSGAKIVASPH